jgi:hypothetical protein
MEKKNQNQADTSRANQNGHLDLLTTYFSRARGDFGRREHWHGIRHEICHGDHR